LRITQDAIGARKHVIDLEEAVFLLELADADDRPSGSALAGDFEARASRAGLGLAFAIDE